MNPRKTGIAITEIPVDVISEPVNINKGIFSKQSKTERGFFNIISTMNKRLT